MVFVYVYIHFWIWTRIRNPGVTDPDPAKVSDTCGSGSTTLLICDVKNDGFVDWDLNSCVYILKKRPFKVLL
jgi:hypothetical protein